MSHPTDSSRSRILFWSCSVVSVVLCALGATAHYLKWAWGNPWQLVGWLLSMVFLLLTFLPQLTELKEDLKSLIKPKTAFFVFWMLFFVVAHFWNFRTAPWNGNGIFDDAAQDVLLVKTRAIGAPFQGAWFESYTLIEHETLFQYYLWPWLHLFGYNILTDEAAVLALWCATFLFTLLLTDLFLQSYVVTCVVALVFTFLPFAFIYSFFAFHYTMAAPLCVASLYFLHVGFKTKSLFCLSLGGIAAGLCLASSLLGKQYILALLAFAVVYAAFYAVVDRKQLKQAFASGRLFTVIYGFVAAAMPMFGYMVFNWHDYAFHESPYLGRFLQAVRGHGSATDIVEYIRNLRICFFGIPGPRLFFPDALPIPLPYYWLLVPGFLLALWQKRFEVVLLATIPVLGVFVSGGPYVEHRLLVAIPFWIILIGFAVNSFTQLREPVSIKILLSSLSIVVLMLGLIPAIQYIYIKAKNPASIGWFLQQEVAVARFLKAIVAGKTPPSVPRLEHDEFSRIHGIPDPPYETLICAGEANIVLHLFLHDYNDQKILSFCAGTPMMVMTGQEIWSRNKNAIGDYVPSDKDLKLVWETGGAATDSAIRMFQSLRDLGTEDSLSFSFNGKVRTFYVLNIPNKSIRRFKQLVKALPAAIGSPLPELSNLPESNSAFEGGRGREEGEFDSPLGIAVAPDGRILVADTGNGRVQEFSRAGVFLVSIGSKGTGHGQFSQPNGIAVDGRGSIYVSEVGNHRVQKLAPDGTFMTEWKGPPPGFYGPRRIAIGSDTAIYVVDQGHDRIVKLGPDGGALAAWGSKGNGDGQFNDPTSVAFDPTTHNTYVADPLNRRIQVFDSNGKFLSKWLVPEWGQPLGFEDVAVDSSRNRLYASSAHMDSVLVFDLKGTRIGSLMPKPPDKLESPSALALTAGKLYVLDMGGNHVSSIGL